MAWSPLPLDTNPDAVTVGILGRIKTRIVGWLPSESDPVTVLVEEVGRETALTNARTLDALDRAVADFGTSVHKVPAIEAQTATLSVRLTVTGAGAVVPAGFRVTGTTTAGVVVAFELLSEATSTGATVDVSMVAQTTGTAANDVPAGPLTVITATATVVSAAALSASSGGVDAETLTAYLDRLTAYLAILRPGGVLADDLAVLARSVPGVHRALGIDNLNPGRKVTATIPSASVTNKALTANVATLTTSAAHGFVAGQQVRVSGVDATFDGTYTIKGVPSATTFTYDKTAADVASAAATGTALSTNLTAAAGTFLTSDVGRTVTGTGVPSGATLASVQSDTAARLSVAASAAGTNVTLTFGDLTGQARTATVVPIDTAGKPVSAAVKAEVKTLIESVRETNFVAVVGEPTYTAVNVNFAAVAETGFDPVAVQAAVHAAALDFISPATFAAGDDPASPTWEPITTVSYLELAAVLGSVDGVDRLTTLTLNGGTSDLTLTGYAPLPAPTDAATPSTITGTVT